MSQVITNAFEKYWQSCLTTEQPVVLDEFILADIPNLDITSPIDPETGLPPESQIVHRQNVDQRGRINNNAVAYTIVMDTTVGDFSFNAMYLRNKQNGVIGMIVYKGRETKLKTDQTTGQTGNSLVKSMLMGYDQAAEATVTHVDAGTWQIDYAARLRGMDEDIRQLQADLYGHHTFVGDGFKVVEKDGAYQVSQGVAIVGGLRVELKAPEVIHPGTKPIGVWVDVHRAGSLLSEHQNHFTIITSVADLADHVDSNGYQHFVAKLATVQADSTIEDGRGNAGGGSGGAIPDTFALWKRSMAEAGYDLIGQFGTALTIETNDQVVISNDGTTVYAWLGALPKDVPADATLENTGGVAAGAWESKADKTLREDVEGAYAKNFKTISDMKAGIVANGKTINMTSIIGQKVFWRGYFVESDGGSNWGVVKSGAHVEDGGRIFSLSPTLYVEANLKGGRISILKFGARADSTSAAIATNNGPIVEKIVAHLKTQNGGEIYVPPVGLLDRFYGLSTSDEKRACIWIDTYNITISGSGETSVFKTYQNSHVPIHASFESDLSVIASSTVMTGFHATRIAVRGTGVYQNFGLAKGRGILIRRAKNCTVTHCTINDMSMIGVCAEGGQGNFLIKGNIIRDCKYSSININGRGYMSNVVSNICSGSNGDVNTTAIQVTGPCNVVANTIYGDINNYANCGGIMWGEGNYDGIGNVANNLITHCRFGIKAILHGSANITGNTVINCRTLGGIIASGGKTQEFTVATSHCLIGNNLLINNYPTQIECSAADCLVIGNIVRNIINPTNPSAVNEPDAIIPVNVQIGIRIRAPGCSVIGNKIDGAFRGIITTLGMVDGAITGNDFANISSAQYVAETLEGNICISLPARERRIVASTFIESLVSSSIPSQGYFPLGSTWQPSGYVIGQPMNAIILQARIDALAKAAASGAITIDIVGTASFITGSNAKVGVQLDDNTFLWTTIAANSGNSITLAAAIPAGRTAPSGNPVYVNVWRAGPNLT